MIKFNILTIECFCILMKWSKKSIFPDLGTPDVGRGFKNFMNQVNNNFPFQVAKQRDGLIGNEQSNMYGLNCENI